MKKLTCVASFTIACCAAVSFAQRYITNDEASVPADLPAQAFDSEAAEGEAPSFGEFEQGSFDSQMEFGGQEEQAPFGQWGEFGEFGETEFGGFSGEEGELPPPPPFGFGGPQMFGFGGPQEGEFSPEEGELPPEPPQFGQWEEFGEFEEGDFTPGEEGFGGGEFEGDLPEPPDFGDFGGEMPEIPSFEE